MSQVIGQGIRHAGIHQEDAHFPWSLAAGITIADVGKAVTIDTSANHTLKLAGDGEEVFGRLETVEDRKAEGILVGTCTHHGGMKFPVKNGEVLAPGDRLIGAGNGEVRKAATATAAEMYASSNNRVTAVNTLGADTCEAIFR